MELNTIKEGDVTYFQIYVSCPICLDKGITQPQQFVTHANNNCNGDMYLGDNGNYYCAKCGTNSNVLQWRFEGCDHTVERANNSLQLYETASNCDRKAALTWAVACVGQIVQATGIAWTQQCLTEMNKDI